jgi:C4-dicarboxylate-specific signal transduction histidine kinase
MDIPAFNFYYLADQEHNPDKKAVWVDEPYVDPAGRGWMISAIAPVYYNDRLVGVPGMDVTVNKIIDKYLEGHSSVFILDKTGVLVAVNHKLVHLLCLPPLDNHEYLETIKSDKYRKNDYNLLKSKDRIIREMAKSIISAQKEDYAFSIDKKKYMAVSVAMDDLSWTLVSILEL